MTKAFDKIAAGLRDAIAYAEGDKTRARVRTVQLEASAPRADETRGSIFPPLIQDKSKDA